MKGTFYGLMSLGGFSDMDPINQQKTNLATINTDTQKIFNEYALQALKNQAGIAQDLYDDLSARASKMDAFMAYNNELLWESIAQDNIFLIVLFITLIIVIFFNLFT